MKTEQMRTFLRQKFRKLNLHHFHRLLYAFRQLFMTYDGAILAQN